MLHCMGLAVDDCVPGIILPLPSDRPLIYVCTNSELESAPIVYQKLDDPVGFRPAVVPGSCVSIRRGCS
jgi:hypothetical protein